MPYATAADFVQRFDERTVKDLVSDSGAPASDLTSNTTLAALLSEASGRVNAAIRAGAVYTQDNLASLIAQEDEDTAMLVGVTCDIAMALLLRRRPERFEASMQLLKQIDTDFLDPLRRGERIFDIDDREDVAQAAEADKITTADINRSNPITHRTRRFYPARATSLPLNRGV